MYNVGILASRGQVVTFCDSDAVFTPAFVETIVDEFRKDNGIVLHLDEIRNSDRRFYPFNTPPIEDIKGKGCINFKNGKSTGLQDKEDPLHTLNYGACMCALRRDLIHIGGADEHIDYFGHICGPYEMTFRLINAGKKEVWHQSEFLYHVWHPGTDGKNNYLGPHDGRYISTTSLESSSTGRVLPLTENPIIKAHRLNNDDLHVALPLNSDYKLNIGQWTVSQLNELSRKQKSQRKRDNVFNKPLLNIKIKINLLIATIRQFIIKTNKFIRNPKDIFKKVYNIRGFFQTMAHQNEHYLQRAFACINTLTSRNVSKFTVYGPNAAAEVLCSVAVNVSLSVSAVYDDGGGASFCGFTVMPIESARDRSELIVVADTGLKREKINKLIGYGIQEDRIVVL
ncbi:MAG: glycosyltransferase [Nitrospirae bacterium]|nr:glycosyltransferase [Nitrospirota bacterium]